MDSSQLALDLIAPHVAQYQIEMLRTAELALLLKDELRNIGEPGDQMSPPRLGVTNINCINYTWEVESKDGLKYKKHSDIFNAARARIAQFRIDHPKAAYFRAELLICVEGKWRSSTCVHFN